MSEIKDLENRLRTAIEKIEKAVNSPQPPEDSGDLAAENASLREQLQQFKQERREDMKLIDQIAGKVDQMMEATNA